MRTFFSLVLLVGGMGLCLFDAVTSAFVSARAMNLYRQQLAAAPNQQTYTRAEYTTAAWQAWTNRVQLPVKEAYTVDDLKDGLFGMGTQQTSCDRWTFEALIADASGYRRPKDIGSGTTFPGVLAMLIGAFLLGGVMFPQDRKGQK